MSLRFLTECEKMSKTTSGEPEYDLYFISESDMTIIREWRYY